MADAVLATVDDGIAVILNADVADADTPAVREAESACPAMAISVR